jgi:toxin FitB
MIVLDTNVLSESLRPKPSARVLEWLRRQSRATLFTTSITEAEIRYGVELLPSGKRRTALSVAITQIFDVDLAGCVLPFDSAAAREFAALAAARRNTGRPISQADAQIAAIVRSRGAALATRDAADFANCEFDVIDPWQ